MAINFGWILILNKFIWHFLRAWCPCYLWAVQCGLCRRCGWSRRRCPPPAPPTGPGYTRCRHTCRTQRAAPARPATCNNQQGSDYRNTLPRIFANQMLQQIVSIWSGYGKHSFVVGRNLQISSWTCLMSMHGARARLRLTPRWPHHPRCIRAHSPPGEHSLHSLLRSGANCDVLLIQGCASLLS